MKTCLKFIRESLSTVMKNGITNVIRQRYKILHNLSKIIIQNATAAFGSVYTKKQWSIFSSILVADQILVALSPLSRPCCVEYFLDGPSSSY